MRTSVVARSIASLVLACGFASCRDPKGNGETGPRVDAPSVRDPAGTPTHLADIVDVEAAGSTVCALAEDGSVYCWEYEHPNSEIATTRPALVPDLPPAGQVGVLPTSAMAVSTSGEVFAWGHMSPCYRETTEVGPGQGYHREPLDPALDVTSAIERHPADVTALDGSERTQERITRRAVTKRLRTSGRAFFVPDDGVCVLDEQQRVSCCGIASDSLGDWRQGRSEDVPRIVDLCVNQSRVGCVVFADGRTECFDSVSMVSERRVGQHVPVSLPAAARSIACDGDFVALLADGSVARWGDDRLAEVRGNLPPATAVEHQSGVTCIIGEDRQVWCRYERALADAFPAAGAEAPWSVEGLVDPRDVALGSGFSCAVQADSSVSCWSANEERWGEGVAFSREVATPKLVPSPIEAEG